MRSNILVVLGLLAAFIALPARADYTITVSNFNMPAPAGLPTGAKCRPYVDAKALTGQDRTCGPTTALVFNVTTVGNHSVSYSTVSALGRESAAQSPALAFVVDEVPPTPTTAPSGTFACTPAAGSTTTFTCTVTLSGGP